MSTGGMKFSLREVFFRDMPESEMGDTTRLLERYGIAVDAPEADPVIDPEATDPTPPGEGSNRLLEKIESHLFREKVVDDKPTGSPDAEPARAPRRDDLALARWRKMAGL